MHTYVHTYVHSYMHAYNMHVHAYNYVCTCIVCIFTYVVTLFVFIIHKYNASCLFSEGENGTPLACAASRGHAELLNYLLGQNVDVNGGIKVCNFKMILLNDLILYTTVDNTITFGIKIWS